MKAHTMTSGVNFTRNFPWMVALKRKSSDNNQTEFFCSGFLISDSHVLTGMFMMKPSKSFDVIFL